MFLNILWVSESNPSHAHVALDHHLVSLIYILCIIYTTVKKKTIIKSITSI